MISVFVVVIYCLCCVCTGALALQACGPECRYELRTGPITLTAALFLLGAGILANVWLLIALAASLTPPAIAIVLFSCGLLGARSSASIVWPVGPRVVEEYRWWLRQRGGLKLVCALAVLILLLFGVAALIKPPTGDAEAYYLTYPKVIAAAQRMTPMPGMYYDFSRIGALAEMQFAALLVIGAKWSGAMFLLWPVCLAAGAMLMGIAARVGAGRPGQWFTLVIMITSTAFSNLVPDGKVDLFAAAWGIAAFFWALRVSNDKGGVIALGLCGLCAGFAAVAKLTYLVALLPSLAMLIVMQCRAVQPYGSTRAIATSIAVFSLWVGVALLPHFLKNAILFGEPFTPFVGASTNSYSQSYYSADDTLWIVATYPLGLVFGQYPLQLGNLSFLMITFLPLVFLLLPSLRPKRGNPIIGLALAAALGTLLWVILRPSQIVPRYLLATLLMFAPFAARAAEVVYVDEVRPRLISAGMILCMVVAAGIAAYPPALVARHAPDYFAQGQDECKFASVYCPALTELNRELAEGERVFLAGSYWFWLRPDILQCQQQPSEIRSVLREKDPARRWTLLFESGFRNVVIDRTSHESVIALFDPRQAPDWLTVSIIKQQDPLIILGIRSNDPGHVARLGCRQLSAPAWSVSTL